MSFSKKFIDKSPFNHRKRNKPHCHAGKRKRVRGSKTTTRTKGGPGIPGMADTGECHGDDTMA